MRFLKNIQLHKKRDWWQVWQSPAYDLRSEAELCNHQARWLFVIRLVTWNILLQKTCIQTGHQKFMNMSSLSPFQLHGRRTTTEIFPAVTYIMPTLTVSCVYKIKQRSLLTVEAFLIGFFDAELKNKPAVLMQLHRPSNSRPKRSIFTFCMSRFDRLNAAYKTLCTIAVLVLQTHIRHF